MPNVATYKQQKHAGVVRESCGEYLDSFDKEVAVYVERLKDFERRCEKRGADQDALFHELVRLNTDILDRCEQFERSVHDKAIILSTQDAFREKTEPYASKSYFLHRARIWPKGYPGDYVTLEGVYRNAPLSEGIGYYFDRHFLVTPLSQAVQARKEMLRDILNTLLPKYREPRMLNVACGSCREVFELAPALEAASASLICVDFDQDALRFAENRLAHAPINPNRLEFRKMNALRMVNHERNQKEFGFQDIVYSMGFFDYVEDATLIRLLNALYRLLNPSGVLIAPFKDSRRYRTQEYHWLADWHHFFQRTEDDVLTLLDRAEIPLHSVKTMRDETGIIVFFLITK